MCAFILQKLDQKTKILVWSDFTKMSLFGQIEIMTVAIDLKGQQVIPQLQLSQNVKFFMQLWDKRENSWHHRSKNVTISTCCHNTHTQQECLCDWRQLQF